MCPFQHFSFQHFSFSFNVTQKNEVECLPSFAATWLSQCRLGYERLAQLRMEELRNMTEIEAGRVFAQLDPPRPYLLRASSGLVEQQRLFAKLRDPVGMMESGT